MSPRAVFVSRLSLSFERISLRVRHTGHVLIVIVLKLLLLVLQVCHRDDVVVLIIRVRLAEAFSKKGQPQTYVSA